MSKLEHIHMTVNAEIDPTFKAMPKADAKRFVDSLLKEIGMKPLGPINWADAQDLDFPGQSFVQMITTSHCSLHLFTHSDGTNEIYFDLYSCKCYNTNRVIELLDKKFGLVKWHGILYTRATDKDPSIKIIGNDTIAKKQQEVLVETN